MAVFAAVFLVVLVTVQCQVYPRFELRGYTSLPNNSYINRARIGEDDDALRCVTDNADCCTDPDTGNWTDAHGVSIDEEMTGNISVYVTRGNKAISLNRYNMTGGGSGMWRCDIPDSSGVMQSIYIYTGISTTGELTSASISFTALHTEPHVSPPDFTLTCRSEGGPATTVSWQRNGATVEEDSDHETSQIIVDRGANTVYENSLRVRGREGGRYQCTVGNNIKEYFQYFVRDRSSLFTVQIAGKPTKLALTWRTNTSVDIGWSSPGSPATGYVIYYQPEGGAISSIDIHGRDVESHLLEGLQSGVTYNISMVALSDHLPSAVVGPLILIPTPQLTAYRAGDEMSGVGSNISLVCEAQLAEGIPCNCVNMRWLKNGREVGTNRRVIVTSTSSGATLQSNISISPLLSYDDGTYRCEVATRSTQGASTNVAAFQDVPLTVAVPSLVVRTSPSILEIPTEFPHNLSNVSCTVHAEAEGQRVPLSITVTWVYRRESQQNSVSFSNIPPTHFTTSGSPEDGYWSILTTTLDNERDRVRCRANLVVDSNIQRTSDIGFVREENTYTAIVTPSSIGYNDYLTTVPTAFTTMMAEESDEYAITTTLNLLPKVTTGRTDETTTIMTPSPAIPTVSVLATTTAEMAHKDTTVITPSALMPTASVREPTKPTDQSEDVNVAAAVGAAIAVVVFLIIIAVVLTLTLWMRMTHHVTCNMQPKMMWALALKKESEADVKEKEGVENKEEKIESNVDEMMIILGKEVVAEDVKIEKNGGGKIDKGTIKEASEEDTDEDCSDGGPSNIAQTPSPAGAAPPTLHDEPTPSPSAAQ